jgi:hypothetical protein
LATIIDAIYGCAELRAGPVDGLVRAVGVQEAVGVVRAIAVVADDGPAGTSKVWKL